MNYELMLVVNPASDSKGLISGVEKTVKDAGAKDVKVQNLGKKQLAYKIKRNTEAEYVLLNFDAEGPAIKSLNDKLRLEQEAVLRYLIIKSQKAVSESFAPKVTAKVTVKAESKEEKAESKKTVKKAVKRDTKTVKVTKGPSSTKVTEGKKKK
jgi:small subunit ribosomal protein S6